MRRFVPRIPGLSDALNPADLLYDAVAGLWVLASGHYRDYSVYDVTPAAVVNPAWGPEGPVWAADGYIDLGDLPQYQYGTGTGTGTFTLEAIFIQDSRANGVYPRIVGKLTNAPYNGYELLVRSPDDGASPPEQNHIYIQTGTGGTLGQQTGPLINLGQRYHVIVVMVDGSIPVFYVDGSLFTGSTFTAPAAGTSTAPLTIGTWAGNQGVNSWAGTVEKVAIYNRALSVDEVGRLSENPYTYFHAPRRPLWQLQGQSGSVTGSAGIVSGEAFGTSGAVVSGYVGGLAGIGSGEAFGTTGTVSGPITGAHGLGAPAMTNHGVVAGPVTGSAGIPTATAFGTTGHVSGPIVGTAGIASATAFGTTGVVYQTAIGSTGIVSGQAFGTTGRVTLEFLGRTGIPSAEAFGHSGVVLGTAQFALFIRGKNRNKYYQVDNGFSATFELRGRGSATFTTKDTAGRYQPNVGDEVVFYELNARRFGGFVETVAATFSQGNASLGCVVTCLDYAELLERRTVTATYNTGTLQLSAIVADIVANSLDGDGIAYVKNEDSTLTDQGALIFNGDTVRVAMDRCADVFGYDWRLDSSRNLFFERNHTVIAPYTLRDNDGRWATMTTKRSRRDFRNVQTIRTTTPTAGLGTTTTVGNGTWTYQVTDAIQDKPTIKVNGTEKIVVKGPAPSNLRPWDFWWTKNSPTVHQNPHQTAYTAADTILITYRNAALDLHTVTDAPSITTQALLNRSTSGKFQVVTRGLNVTSAPVAQQVGTTLLTRFNLNPVEIDIVLTNKTTGWEIGQVLPISTSLIQGLYIIKTVAFQETGKTYLLYTLTAYGIDPPLVTGITKTSNTTVDVTTVDPLNLGTGVDVTLTGLNPPFDTLPVGIVDGNGTPCVIEYPAGTSLPPVATSLSFFDPVTYDSLVPGAVSSKSRPEITIYYAGYVPIIPVGLPVTITASAPYIGLVGLVVDSAPFRATVQFDVGVTPPPPTTTVTLEGAAPWNTLPAGVVLAQAKPTMTLMFPLGTGVPPAGTSVRVEGLTPWDTLPFGVVLSSGGGVTTITLPTGTVIPDTPYTGGTGGTIDGGTGLGTGNDPFGGGIYSGSGPAFDTPLGAGQGAPIPISYVVDGGRIPEFTTDRDHGKLDGASVTIVGVTGGDHNGVFNTQNTRINVTASNKFRALDNFVPTSLTDAFQDDKKGRVYDANAIPRPILTNGPTNTLLTYLQGMAADPVNPNNATATFVLAAAIPGFASRALVAGNNVTNPYIAQKDGVIDNVSAAFNTPPIGGPIIIDILQHAGGVGSGVSIFGDTKLVVPAESTGVTTVSDFSSAAVTVAPGDTFSLNVNQVGSDFAGCNGSVVMSIRG